MRSPRYPGLLGGIVASLLLFSANAQAVPCDLADPDNVAGIAFVRAAITEHCDCAGDRRAYLRCARETVDSFAVLGKECNRHVLRCTRRSTCGRPGAVTCCVTSPTGRTRCRIARDAESCRAPRGGGACVGAFASCCDACTGSGCTVPPTPSPEPTASPAPSPTPPQGPFCCVMGPFCTVVAPPGQISDCTIQGGTVVAGQCVPSDDPGCPVPGACGSCVPPPTP